MTRLPPRPRPVKKPTITELWERFRPGTPPPRLGRSLPFLSQEKTDLIFLGLLVRLVQLEQFKNGVIASPVFAAWIIFSIAGYYTTLRAIYRDQFWTYGVRQHLPGVAHQIQNQRFTTFQYITAPTAVEKARRLGTKFSESVASASPTMQFLETPFLKRLDMYPNVALVELTPAWSSLVGENYTTTRTIWSRSKRGLRRRRGVGRSTGKSLELRYTTSSINPIEYRPMGRIDRWAQKRLDFDLADEVPTRLDDGFGLRAGVRGARGRYAKPSFLQPMSDFFNPQKAVVTGPFSTMHSPVLDFQTSTPLNPSLLYGIPVAEPANPQMHLPKPMLDVTPRRPHRQSAAVLLGQKTKKRPLAPLSASRPSLIALDKALGKGKTSSPTSFETILKNVGRRKRQKALVAYQQTRRDPLGFSPTHPLRHKSWLFDFVGLTRKELRTKLPKQLPPPPEPPLGYADYRQRRRTFSKTKETGPLVKTIKQGTNLLKYPENISNFVEALRDYRRAMEAYRLQKLAVRASERKYAPIQRKLHDLRQFWNEQLPQALLEHIQKLPVASDATRDATRIRPFSWSKGKGASLTSDYERSPGSLDWFAHLPVTQREWLWLLHDLRVRKTPESTPLTVEDTRALLQKLFKSKFQNPNHFEVGRLKRTFLQSLKRAVRKNQVNAAETRGMRDFYTALQRRGLSAGPVMQKRRRFFRRHRRVYQSIPASWRITTPLRGRPGWKAPLTALTGRKAHTQGGLRILNDRRFYAPMTDWMDYTYIRELSDYQFKMPKGAEFHWALHANNLAASSRTTQEFVDAIAPQLGKIRPLYRSYIDARLTRRPNIFLAEDRLSRAQEFREALYTQTHAYLRRVETSGVLGELAVKSKGLKFVDRLQTVTNIRRVANDLARVIGEQGSLATVGPYRHNWSRSQPKMNGFFFPDTDRKTLHHQIQMSKPRYKLGSKSLWEGFRALTSVRPLEILLPPGYRLFVSRSLPDFSRPGSIKYRPVQIFPKYEVARQPSLLPSYEVLKTYYTDLDVSFLPEIPKPRLLHERSILDIESNMRETVAIGPYPNYFQYATTLARQNGDIATSPSALHLIQHYYLGAQNWVKDMPRNFLGFQGFARGNQAPRSVRKTQREQVKTYSTSYEKTVFAGPDEASRLPSQLEDGTMRWTKIPQKIVDRAKEGFFAKKTYPQKKHTSHLDAYQILTLPQLTMDEWHDIFKTSLERARLTGEMTLNLDIPPIRPVVYHRPNAFAGKIHVDLLATPEKQRSQAVAQILLLASEAKLGAYNLLDYVGPRALYAANPSPTPGTARRVLPIFWHYSPTRLSLVNSMAPTLYDKSGQRRLTNVALAWESAEAFIARQKRQRSPFKRLNAAFEAFAELAGFAPTEVLGIETKARNYEPVTIYSWFILSQFLIVPVILALTQLVKFLTVRDLYIEAHYRFYPLFKSDPYVVSALARSLRACYNWTGQVPYEPFRIFRNIKRRFTDIVGIEPDVLCRSGEIALTLRNRGRGGPASPKGVLLFGPPGNGKTFLVQAIAGEADVPLIALTTSELLDKRKHDSAVEGLIDAFKLAKELAPCILFIDEIDGLGKKRSSMIAQEAATPNPEDGLWPFVRTVPPRTTLPFIVRGKLNQAYVEALINPILAEKKLRERSIEGLMDRKHYNIDTEDDWRSEYPVFEAPAPRKVLSPTASARVALVTSFLTLMDYLRPQDGIVVIGATNRMSVLDPAVRRSGRLDVHIAIHAPADERRVELMRYYTSRLGLQESIPWDYMTERTRAYSVADLETMVNHSAIRSILEGKQHTLDSLEDALEATARHRHIRANRIPYPIVKKRPKYDPLFFVRIGYYQASRALVHNILPEHPSLPFVQMQLEPFAPEVPIEKLVRRPYTLQDLEDRLAAMLAGKAGEFLLLYGCPFTTQEEINERQMFESNLGVEELSYAVDLAYAIVDQWLLIDDFTLPIRKALKLQEGENDEMFFEPGGDIGRPHFLRYNLEEAGKYYARQTKVQTSMFDKKFRIHNNLVDTLRWFAETKASMNLVTEHFVKWVRLFAPLPFERNVWEPVEQYYAQRPHFKVLNPSKPSPNEKMTEVKVRPTFPDLALIDRDYLMQAVILKCFNNALELLDKHRTVVDRMADHLLRKKKLRSFEMHAYIQAYTAELREIEPETKVRTVPGKGDVPDLRTKPASRLRTVNGRVYLEVDQSWGPESLKPYTKSLPMDLFATRWTPGEGVPDSDVWSDKPIPAITFDVWRQPIQEREFLVKLDSRFREQRQNYATRYNDMHQLHVELCRIRIEEINAKRDEKYRFVEDLLLSMVPPLEAYIHRLDEGVAEPGAKRAVAQGEEGLGEGTSTNTSVTDQNPPSPPKAPRKTTDPKEDPSSPPPEDMDLS